MNKQEAIEKIKNIDTLNINDKIAGQQVDMVIKNQVISQIDEPQKPVVPKFVGEWLEKSDWRKDTLGRQTIFDVFDNLTLDASNGFYVDVKKWVEENGNIFAQAWVFGYEIEQEKLYTVEIPNPALDNLEFVIVLKRIRGRVCLVNTYDYMGRELSDEYQLTESEIKQDFDFLWQFAKEVE